MTAIAAELNFIDRWILDAFFVNGNLKVWVLKYKYSFKKLFPKMVFLLVSAQMFVTGCSWH